MGTLIVNLEGTPVVVAQGRVELSKLQLDQDNPRIGLYRDSQPKTTLMDADIRHAIRNRSPNAYSKLRDSIEINGAIINPIWIGPEVSGRHLVIEGNTRVLIYRELTEKYPADDKWKTIPANILPVGIQDSQLNFIRLEAHLRGVTEWDAYERARYLYILNEDEGYSVPRLEQLTRLIERFAIEKQPHKERIVGEGGLRLLRTALSPFSIRRLKDDVLELPEKIYETIVVDLEPSQRRRYDELREELHLSVVAMDGTTVTDDASNILKRLLRLVQISSNPKLIDASYGRLPKSTRHTGERFRPVHRGRGCGTLGRICTNRG